MLRQVRHLAAAMALAVPSLVCAQQPAAPAAPAGPADTAARVGDRVITVKEVDEAWQRTDASSHMRATQTLYDGRRQALDSIIAELLIQQAAKAKGVTSEQFLQEEVSKRIKPVADAEIDLFYEQNKAQMQGKPLEQVRPLIRNFLVQQQRAAARDSVVAGLRKGGPAIHVALDPPRQKVEIASTDPSRGAANAAVVLVEFSDYQ